MRSRTILPPLPAASFASIALDLRSFAESAWRAHHAGELLVAQGGWSDRFAHTIDGMRASAATAGELYEFFRARAEPDDERRLRRLIEAIDAYPESGRRWRVGK